MSAPVSSSTSSQTQPLHNSTSKNSSVSKRQEATFETGQGAEKFDYENRKALFGSFEDAIKIFVETLKHQDPLDPQDPSELASRFAEFGQIIGLLDVKDELIKSTEMQKNTQMLQAAAQIDKTGTFEGNKFYFSGTKSSEINFTPPHQAKYCSLAISTLDNKIITSKTIEVTGGEKNTFVWDGKDRQQHLVDRGTYRVKVLPWDENRKPVMNPKTKQQEETKTYIKDQVAGGIRREGQAMVMIGGEQGASYSLDNLIAIYSQPPALSSEEKNNLSEKPVSEASLSENNEQEALPSENQENASDASASANSPQESENSAA